MHISKVYISHDYISFYSYHPAIGNIIHVKHKNTDDTQYSSTCKNLCVVLVGTEVISVKTSL